MGTPGVFSFKSGAREGGGEPKLQVGGLLVRESSQLREGQRTRRRGPLGNEGQAEARGQSYTKRDLGVKLPRERRSEKKCKINQSGGGGGEPGCRFAPGTKPPDPSSRICGGSRGLAKARASEGRASVWEAARPGRAPPSPTHPAPPPPAPLGPHLQTRGPAAAAAARPDPPPS